jgi:hypothetical protein
VNSAGGGTGAIGPLVDTVGVYRRFIGGAGGWLARPCS